MPNHAAFYFSKNDGGGGGDDNHTSKMSKTQARCRHIKFFADYDQPINNVKASQENSPD